MAVNYDVLLQPMIFDMFAVPCTFHFQNGKTQGARGILNTYSSVVQALDGSFFSDQRTILDIRDSEFSTMPIQNDHVIIPQDSNGVAKGEYQIVDLLSDGGGQTTLTIREYKTVM